MTENGTLLRTKSASFGGWILFLLETFFLSVGNQKKKFHNFLIQLPMAGLKIEFCNLYFDRVHHAATCLEWVQKAPLFTFDIPQTALVATLDTYDFLFCYTHHKPEMTFKKFDSCVE
jgi:hypothetical protein